MDNASGPRFVSLPFLIGFGLGIFIGVALALVAVEINDPEDVSPRAGEAPALATAAATSPPEVTPVATVTARVAAAIHVGPGEEFATIGTVARGDALDVIGRDFDNQWLAIRFPAGSSIRGWIPAAAADGMSFDGLRELAVLLPTPLPIEIPTPSPFLGTPVTTGTGTPEADEATPGPPPTTLDLAAFAMRALSDGRVRVTVLNGGPADLTDAILVVTVRTLSLQSETINYTGDLPAGATVALTTSSFTVGTEPIEVQVVVDPSGSLNDPNRTNNVASEVLSRPVEATPTPTASAE